MMAEPTAIVLAVLVLLVNACVQGSDAKHPDAHCAKDAPPPSNGEIPREWYGTTPRDPDIIPALAPPPDFIVPPPAQVTPAPAQPAASEGLLDYPPPDLPPNLASGSEVIPALAELPIAARPGHSLLAIDPTKSPYAIQVPREYVGCGQEYVTQIEICVTMAGKVSDVRILRPSIPVIDLQVPRVIPHWSYERYLVDGRPTGFCYSLNYRVR